MRCGGRVERGADRLVETLRRQVELTVDDLRAGVVRRQVVGSHAVEGEQQRPAALLGREPDLGLRDGQRPGTGRRVAHSRRVEQRV